MAQFDFSCPVEELNVFRVGAWIACFDVTDPDIIQSLDDMQFVRDGKRYPFALGPIAQSAVQYLYFFHNVLTGDDSNH